MTNCNIFACLVHESPECVLDMVRNLRYFDPASFILLYNGGNDPRLLNHRLFIEQDYVLAHPRPRPITRGRLHGFALDCMQFALDHLPFGTLTIVDSDQLATRSGYSFHLAQFLASRSDIGLIASSPSPQPTDVHTGHVWGALKEINLWRPFLRRFSEGEKKFIHWSFWPGTVFTAEAARDLTQLFATDKQLHGIMHRTKIWATEEIILPTLVALLGYKIATDLCSQDYLKCRVHYTIGQVDEALTRPDVFWIHPISRRYKDPLRRYIRARFNFYGSPNNRNAGAEDLVVSRQPERHLHETIRLSTVNKDSDMTVCDSHLSVRLARSKPTVPTVTVVARFIVFEGYGSLAEHLVLGLVRGGAAVNVVPLCLSLGGFTAEFQAILQHSRPDANAPVLYFCWPGPNLARFQKASALIINTMWESSLLPAGWAEQLNRACAVIVPTRFVAQGCRQSGVTVPIEVIPEGIDHGIYHYQERPDRPGLTTLIVGTLINRKNFLKGIAAWKLAFTGIREAQLIIKTSFNPKNYVPDDPRICLVDSSEPTRGIAQWYRQADVLLALGNEGFGLPLVEGMATGLPVIALNSEGQADICKEARDFLLPVEPAHWRKYDEAPFGPCGVRGIPDVKEVADRLRWVASHRDEAREMGRAASDWIVQHRNIWAKGPSVLAVMEHYVR